MHASGTIGATAEARASMGIGKSGRSHNGTRGSDSSPPWGHFADARASWQDPPARRELADFRKAVREWR